MDQAEDLALNPARPVLTEAIRQVLSTHIEQLCGIHLGPEKAYLLEHRLTPLINRYKLAGFEGLKERLVNRLDPEIRDRVIEAVATHETAFFRDRHPFEALRLTVLPQAAKRWQATRDSLGQRPRPIRIWSAACSSGQEPWSVAMAIQEWLPLCGVPGLAQGDFLILATDLSPPVLSHAREGIYTEAEVARGLTTGQRARFTVQLPGPKPRFQIKPELRAMVEFRCVNLLENAKGLGLFDVILCRNVLIYFTDALKRQICEMFHSMLMPGGYLILGAAESLFGITESFQTERAGDTLLFRKP